MKKLTALLAMIILGCSALLFGCSASLTMPQGTNISSNGGNVVNVGEYVYFANGYTGYSSLTDGDNDGNSKELSFYRVKTNNGALVLDDEDNITNLEKVVSKVSGFETSNLYVSGQNMFFTTPNIHRSETSSRFDLVTLFKVKLDGTGLKEILTTDNASAKFTFKQIAGKSYCFVADGKNLKRVQLFDNFAVKTIANDVSECAIDKASSATAYYTAARDDSHTGNELKKINLLNEETQSIYKEIGTTFKLVALMNNILYYQKSTTVINSLYYFYNNMDLYTDSYANFINNEQDLIHATAVTNFTCIEKNALGGHAVAFVFENQIQIKVFNDSRFSSRVIAVDENTYGTPSNILLAYDEYIFFKTSKGIYRVDYKGGEIQTITTVTEIQVANCDFDGRYFYFFAKNEGNTTGTYYMHRVDINSNAKTTELIAKLKTADVKVEEDN